MAWHRKLSAHFYNSRGRKLNVPIEFWRSKENWERFSNGRKLTNNYQTKKGEIGNVKLPSYDAPSFKLLGHGAVLFEKTYVKHLVSSISDSNDTEDLKQFAAELKWKQEFAKKSLTEKKIEAFVVLLPKVTNILVNEKIVPEREDVIKALLLQARKSKRYSNCFEKNTPEADTKNLNSACKELGFNNWTDYKQKEFIEQISDQD